MLTDKQKEIAGHLLAGLDNRRVVQRMGISNEALKADLHDMRLRLGVDGHQAMMGRLREMRRDPASAMVERCRIEPKQWWHT